MILLKKMDLYFVPQTGKSYVGSAKNKRKLFLDGDFELQGELFIHNRFIRTMQKIVQTYTRH